MSVWAASPEEIDRILLDPSVRESLGEEEYCRPSGEDKLILTDGNRLVVFVWGEDASVLAHIFCPAGFRGRGALAFARACLNVAKSRGARLVWGETPCQNSAALIFARSLGFRQVCRAVGDDGISYSVGCLDLEQAK